MSDQDYPQRWAKALPGLRRVAQELREDRELEAATEVERYIADIEAAVLADKEREAP